MVSIEISLIMFLCWQVELPKLLHRHAENGMAGQSHMGRSSVLVLYFTVTTWNVSSPTTCLVLWGRQFCCSLVSPSEQLQETRCQRTITFFSQEAASCLYRAGSVAFASKIYTNLFFPGACNLSLPHLPSMCLEREVLPIPPPTSPRDVSQCPL